MQLVAPESVGLCSTRLEVAAQVLEDAVCNSSVPLAAASIAVARRGKLVLARGYGKMSGKPNSQAVSADSIFMMASVTKPVTAMAVMMLVEDGLLSLQDPVHLYLPDFVDGDRVTATVGHLLTHTSGLPDMLPANTALRRAGAPLSKFVDAGAGSSRHENLVDHPKCVQLKLCILPCA